MRRETRNTYRFLIGLAIAGCCVAMVGCSAPPANVQKAEATLPPPAPTERPSALSYGAINGMVKKNVTTQLDLLNLFGGANIMTTDADGTEVWVYERTTSTTDTAGANESRNLEAFFGAGGSVGPAVVGGGVAGGSRSATDARRTSSSVHTLTVIVKFNPDKTVKDCQTRASYF